MYTVLYIVIYALFTHISCTNMPPSCQSNITLPCDKAILVATAAFLLCGSCMGTFQNSVHQVSCSGYGWCFYNQLLD